MEKRGDRANGISTTAEAKHVESIVRLELLHEKGIGIAHIAFEAIAESQTEKLGHLSGDASQRADGLHRAEPGMIEGDLPSWIVAQHTKQLQNVGVVRRELIRGPIAANDDVLCHRVSPRRR
jgi:hypothetical protein